MHASTAVSAFDASFAQCLVEALAQLAEGAEAVLLAAYDGPATGPLETMSHSRGLLGAALVLSHGQGDLRLRATLVDGQRSAEHTSELQSLMRNSYAVFCLKKKNKSMQTLPYYQLARITPLPTTYTHINKYHSKTKQ